jgi:hypothetical protein
MLKDLLKNQKPKEKEPKKDKILNSLMDGYVDIKAYKHEKDGTKKLVYHDTGDNTITDWMRHVIMLLLSGYSLSYSGSTSSDSIGENNKSAEQSKQVTKPDGDASYHSSYEKATTYPYNADGYCVNGEQYLWDSSLLNGDKHYPIGINGEYYNSDSIYALFPTKILLGTGCEYTDWQSLKDANEIENSTWYTERITEYGDGELTIAEKNFNAMVGLAESDDGQKFDSNVYSGTVGMQGVYTGSGSLMKAITVNDPDTTSNISTSADMSKRYGVVGAIKTLYCPNSAERCSNFLQDTISDAGLLIEPKYRGAGRPCFVYFRRAKQNDEQSLDWDNNTSDISVSRDNTTNFLNRLTFKIEIPAQSSGTGAIGQYNPFNGYTIKQIGLFNDALFSTESGAKTESIIAKNMPCGTMLAIKNVQNFTKSADESIVFTWTLTI